jgi:hypothetical protein
VNFFKNVLTSAKVLVHYVPSKPIIVACDASAYGVGAVLSHTMPDGTERPVIFASRTLNSNERNYTQLDKEAAAITFAVTKFRTFLLGRNFEIITDHKPLLGIFRSDKHIPEVLSPRMLSLCLLLAN